MGVRCYTVGVRVQLPDGVRLFVDVEGLALAPEGPSMRERPTLVLLHGGEVDHSWFKPRFSILSDVAQLVYVDHRGFGRSDRSSRSSWTLAQWGDDVYELCCLLGIERPVVLGSSFGGVVAMSYASRHPDHPGQLVLASTVGRRNVAYQLDMYERLGGAEARAVAERFLVKDDRSAQPEWIRTCAPLNARYTWSDHELARLEDCTEVMTHWADGESRSYNVLADLAHVACPTLLVAGRDDPLAPPTAMAEILDSLPAGFARLEVVDGAGHGVCRDAPNTFFPLVRDFISDEGA